MTFTSATPRSTIPLLTMSLKTRGRLRLRFFVKNGDQYQRMATTLKNEDDTSAVGTALDANSPALAMLNNGEGVRRRRALFSARLT